jgi:hypothetical protein
VILVGVVTEEVATGFVVFQFKVVLQLLAPTATVQLEAERVPDITFTSTVTLPQGGAKELDSESQYASLLVSKEVAVVIPVVVVWVRLAGLFPEMGP